MELIVTGIYKKFLTENGELIFCIDIPVIKFPLGKVTYILGHNGSGKSLFLKLLNQEYVLTSGELLIHENNINLYSSDNLISLVRQRIEDNLCLELTVEENILTRLQPTTILEKLFPKKYLMFAALNAIDDQPELKKKYMQSCIELSSGQKQTLAFYLAIINKCKILCLDEFLSSTDYKTSTALRKKSTEYAKSNYSAVVIVSHDIQTALDDADLIYIFNNGRLTTILNKISVNWNYTYIANELNQFKERIST